MHVKGPSLAAKALLDNFVTSTIPRRIKTPPREAFRSKREFEFSGRKASHSEGLRAKGNADGAGIQGQPKKLAFKLSGHIAPCA